MAVSEALRLRGFDHIEFAVADLERASELYHQLGFVKAGSRELRERQLRSLRMVSGDISIVLSQSQLSTDAVAQYVKRHGDGVFSIGLLCDDAVSALEVATQRGARLAEGPKTFQLDGGSVTQSSIFAFGELRHTFVSRTGNVFLDGFLEPDRGTHDGFGLLRIDHVTSTVEPGKLDEWSTFYERTLGLRNMTFVDSRLGLHMRAMESADGSIRLLAAEPFGDGSTAQEFLDVHHGTGVQHVAFASDDLVSTIRPLRRQGVSFLGAPDTYYRSISHRMPQLESRVDELRELGVLADGNSDGHLLQVFTQKLIGAFFYEIVERRGENGFGEGNYNTVLEAIARSEKERNLH